MDQPLCAALRAKILEQVERIIHLTQFLPADLGSRPLEGGWSFEQLLEHLLVSLAGFCAVLAAAYPDELAHFQRLRSARPSGNFAERAGVYRAHIEEGFGLLSDEALNKMIPTVFVPAGESVLTLLLGNLEHLINHKHQLFTYLKLSGAAVGTPDLYRLRG
jgi:hypothetical protein